MTTNYDIRKLIINKLTDAQYESATKNADELYLTPDTDELPSQSGQSGKFLTTDGSNASWGTPPQGTVTSVRVQAGTGLSSSTSTEQTTTLNTTISIATGYKLPTTTEWNNLPSAPTVTTITDTTYSLSVAENTIYEFSNAVTSLTISSVVKSYLESMIYFTTGSSISFTDNSTLKWGGGSIPSLEVNTTYCIAIKNGLAEIDKFGR